MSRKTAALLLVLVLALPLLSGCHGSEKHASFNLPEVFDETTPLEITFWAKNDTNKTQVEVYEKAISGFETLYPNVKVNLRLYTDYSRIYNDVITNISTDTTPDVCITYPDHIATYLTGSNVVVPLDDLMVNRKYGLGGTDVRFDAPKTEEIVPEFLEECTIGGHYYALPYMRSTEALYINRDYVEKLGYTVPDVLTWDFIWEVSETAMEKDADGLFRVNGQKVMIPFIYKSTDNMMISMLKQLDAPYSTEKGEILIFGEETRKILREIYAHGKSRAFSTFAISSYPANFLNAGQCIFAVDSTAGATWMGSDAPLLDIPADQLVPFETVVRPIPQYDAEHPRMISQGPSVCIFSKENSQEVLASWLFVQYLLTNDIQIAYAETEGYVPVTLKAQQSDEYRDYIARKGEDKEHYAVKIAAAQLLMDHTADTFVTPVFNGSASLRTAAGQLIENIVKGARRKEEMNDAYLDKQFADVTSLYRLDQILPAADGAEEDSGEPAVRPDPVIPTASWILLGAIVLIWLCIGVASLIRLKKNHRKN